jgi:hypothetical protein
MILEQLGPKGQIFDELEPGDYLFEISEPGDKGWLFEKKYVDENNQPTGAEATFITWRLKVIQPEESSGRNFFHMTMLSASEQKISEAKKPYRPDAFTYQFLADTGIAIKQGNDAIVLDDYLTKGHIDLNKTIGVQFWASLRKGVNPNMPDRVGVSKVWQDK